MFNFVLTFCATALHELGHLVAAYLLGVPIKGIRYRSTGPRILMGGVPGYRQEILIAAAGPICNLGTFFICTRFLPQTERLSYFAATSLFLGVLNLLPFRNTDGSKILYALIGRISDRAAYYVCKVCHSLMLSLFWAIAVYLLLRTGSAILLFTFTVILFSESLSETTKPTS